MATFISTSSQWFYEKTSDVLFVNEQSQKVGILTDAPQYELEVRGAVFAESYCNLPAFALSNDVYPKIIYGSNTATYASNNMIVNSHTVTLSNLNVLNTIQRNGSNIVGTNGKIDYVKWLSNCPTYSNDGSLNIAGLVLGATGVVSGLGGILLSQTGAGKKLADDLNNKLGGDSLDPEYDPSQDEDNLFVHWNSLIYPPIYNNRGSSEVGFKNNVFFADTAKLCRVSHYDLISYDGGRTKRILPQNGVSVIYDVGTDTLNCQYINCTFDIESETVTASNITASNFQASNVLITSNMQCPIIVSDDIITNKISGNRLKIGNFYLTIDGLFVGNPDNPFTSQLVLDAYGNYKGTINKDQVVNMEGFNLSALADGSISWNGYGTTDNPLFNDPFSSVGNPLFDV